jgi:AraC-like DNA-binding protein
MQWVRDQRLILAHQKLTQAEYGDTVTTVATSCGFSGLGKFAQQYFMRFNELPSATLRNALK